MLLILQSSHFLAFQAPVKYTNTTPFLALSLIHRLVRMSQQCFQVHPVFRIERNTQTALNIIQQHTIAQGVRLTKHPAQNPPESFSSTRIAFPIKLRDRNTVWNNARIISNDNKSITTQPSHHIFLSKTGLPPLSQSATYPLYHGRMYH